MHLPPLHAVPWHGACSPQGMRPWAVGLLAVSLAGPVAVVPAWSQVMPVSDADADGVPDDVDACLDSPPYELVDAQGCSLCDCEGDANDDDWSSRGAYMRCVLGEIHARRLAKTITRKDARLALKAARNSTCGIATRVRCCIMFPGRPDGICRVMDELRCNEAVLNASTVEDHESGSCFPNPCVFE